MSITQANRTFELTIGGRGVAGESYIDVVNPATEAIVGRAPDATRQQLDDAVSAAQRALPAWSATPISERQGVVRAIATAIAENVEELAQLLTAEQGKPLAFARLELLDAAQKCINFAALTPPVEVHEDSELRRCETHHVPIGVVAAIAPWNVPIGLASWKVAPALVAGNTVILKPSPFTPLATLRLGELLRDLLPPGVLNVISGGDQLGPWLTNHPGINKISFTGSSATGRRVMESASATLKRVTLELGGNDAAIVLPGADVGRIAGKLFQAAFANSGQICVATKRLFVHDDVYEPLAQALSDLARGAKVGDGAAPGTEFGPVQNKPQYDRVRGLIADCRANNYRFLAGDGEATPDKGYFIPITIIDNPPMHARIVQEEQFGPVLPLLRYTDIDMAVELANSTDFGLGASVWGPAVEAAEVASRIDAGTVWVNEPRVLGPTQPFGGHKQSGIGVENGMAGLLEYTNVKTIVIGRTT